MFSFTYINLNNTNKKTKFDLLKNTQKSLEDTFSLNNRNSYDQRLNLNLTKMRKQNNDLEYFDCDVDSNQWDSFDMQLNVIVLNTHRKINFSSYLFKTTQNYNVIILNTTNAAKTNDWTRNCQQAHTQALDSCFHKEIDYLLILEDDIFENNNVTEKQYKNILKCAIYSKVHFLFLMNLNIHSKNIGMVCKLI
jgi:hypothetical protein